jgi:Tol biopolymer transport system component
MDVGSALKGLIHSSAWTLLWLAGAEPAAGQITQRVSLSSAGIQQNGWCESPSISADGRYVLFTSIATNLVSVNTLGAEQVFLRDRATGVTEIVSVSSAGLPGNSNCLQPSLSSDGRFVVFQSWAWNLVPGDTTLESDVFLRDRQTGVTELISIDSAGTQGNLASAGQKVSDDGRYVAFGSHATNLVAGDTNGRWDVFVRDRQLGTTERTSLTSAGSQATGDSYIDSMSPDGRYVSFHSNASNLVAVDANGRFDVFLRDRQTGSTELVSLGTSGRQGNGDSSVGWISADARYVAFVSSASNLVPGDANGAVDAFVRDRQTGITERVSLGPGGIEANGNSETIWISPDARYAVFRSDATNLVLGDSNGVRDVFIRDLQSGVNERASVGSDGAQGNGASDVESDVPVGSADGRYVAFVSGASNLVPGDTNGNYPFGIDVFVRDRTGGTSFTSLCDPGAGGVIVCPCANPPSGTGRGCENSASTGGASLSAAGGPFLSSDSLVFTTSGEKPVATSVLLQGTSSLASGAVYGQGVSCVGGTLKHLFTKTASGGSITAPNFASGDPTVSARSAAEGNPISAGQSRWYLVFYRDPTVLGGCPSGSTFNATQTGLVAWSP